MKCPTCRGDLEADRAPGGTPFHLPNGRFVHVVASRCPYPACASLVVGLAERDAITTLVDRRSIGRSFTKRALLDVGGSLFASAFALVFFVGPLGAMRVAFLHPTRGCGSMLVILGGTLLVVPALAFLLAGTVALVQQWCATQRARAKTVAGVLGGLRLSPVPQAYRR